METSKWILAVVVAAALAPAPAASQGAPAIVMRVYNIGAVGDERVHATIDEADRILREIGITAVWLTCTGPAESVDARCRESVGDLDFVVRLQGSRADGYVHTCGSAIRPQTPQAGHVITLFLDCVERTADAFCVRYETVLAHCLAHELGHLLLPTARHSDWGIMVASPTALDWQRAALGRLRFSDYEAAQMRAGVEKRVRAAAALIAKRN